MRLGDILGNIRSANNNVDFSTIPLESFQETIEGLDWFYNYSDDHTVYTSGANCFERLSEFLKTAPKEYRQIYNLVNYNMYDKALQEDNKDFDIKNYIPVFPEDGFPQ